MHQVRQKLLGTTLFLGRGIVKTITTLKKNPVLKHRVSWAVLFEDISLTKNSGEYSNSNTNILIKKYNVKFKLVFEEVV